MAIWSYTLAPRYKGALYSFQILERGRALDTFCTAEKTNRVHVIYFLVFLLLYCRSFWFMQDIILYGK